MTYEKILFNITFSTQVENSKDPCLEIFLNDKVVVPKQEIKNNQKLEFELTLQKFVDYELVLDRTNHDEKNKQILSIENFTVDNIDLNKLLDDMYFYPKYPTQWHKQQTESGVNCPKQQKGWRSWGFNGRWIMNFKSPFYTWLLENT
jgi:hypothetical protein